MAVLAATKIGNRRPNGEFFEQVFRVTVASQSATDEWIATEFESINSVTGITGYGTTGIAAVISSVLNASGTGATEGDTPGNLGLETSVTTNQDIHVTVLGR